MLEAVSTTGDRLHQFPSWVEPVLSKNLDSLEDIASISEATRYDIGSDTIVTAAVSERFFPLLGVPPELGQYQHVQVKPSPSINEIVISYRAWCRVFHSDHQIIGKVVVLGGRDTQIIAVAPPYFSFPDAKIDAWEIHPNGLESARDDTKWTNTIIARQSTDNSTAGCGSDMYKATLPYKELHPFPVVKLECSVMPPNLSPLFAPESGLVVGEIIAQCIVIALIVSAILISRRTSLIYLHTLYGVLPLSTCISILLKTTVTDFPNQHFTAFSPTISLLSGIACFELLFVNMVIALANFGLRTSSSKCIVKIYMGFICVVAMVTLTCSIRLTWLAQKDQHLIEDTKLLSSSYSHLLVVQEPLSQQAQQRMVKQTMTLSPRIRTGETSMPPWQNTALRSIATFGLGKGQRTTQVLITIQFVSPSYFDAMGLRIVAGRLFANDSCDIVINEKLESALRLNVRDLHTEYEIPLVEKRRIGHCNVVGIVSNLQDVSIGASQEPEAYIPISGPGSGRTYLVVRDEDAAQSASTRKSILDAWQVAGLFHYDFFDLDIQNHEPQRNQDKIFYYSSSLGVLEFATLAASLMLILADTRNTAVLRHI